MCTYNITLDDQLVAEAKCRIKNEMPFQMWLQLEVEAMLKEKFEYSKKRQTHRRHRGLSDEELDRELESFPPLTDADFPDLTAADYAYHMKAMSGRVPKGLEKWL